MTLTLELSDTVAAQLEADAHAQGRPVAQVAADALTQLYDDADLTDLTAILQEPLADALRESFADADAGRTFSGDVVFAELRQIVGRTK